MNPKFLLPALFFSLSSFAIGTATLSGQVTSFDEKTVTLKLADGSQAKLPKTTLSAADHEKLRPDMTVTVTVDERILKKSISKPKQK
jgi:hypothetical protein